MKKIFILIFSILFLFVGNTYALKQNYKDIINGFNQSMDAFSYAFLENTFKTPVSRVENDIIGKIVLIKYFILFNERWNDKWESSEIHKIERLKIITKSKIELQKIIDKTNKTKVKKVINEVVDFYNKSPYIDDFWKGRMLK